MSENKNIEFIIRAMRAADCEQVRQNWSILNFGLPKYANEVMMTVDPNGLLVAEDVRTGKIVGNVSGVNISSELGFIGQLSVLPEYRDQGIGNALFKKALDHIGPERNIGCYAKEERAKKYRDRYNFIIYDELCVNYSGTVDTNLLTQEVDGVSVVPIDETNVEKVIQYDRQVFGSDRTVFLTKLTSIDEYVNGVAINGEGAVLGYCVLTLSNFGTYVCEPLYADDQNIAEVLLANCCNRLDITRTKGLRFPCSSENPMAHALAIKLGLKFEGKRPVLFTKQLVPINDRIFCMSSRCFYQF